MNIIDIAIIVILIIGVVKGLTKGFIQSCISFVGFIVAFMCAKLFSPRLAEYLSVNTNIGESISVFVTKRLNSLSMPTMSIPTADIMIPKELDSTLLKTPEYIKITKHFPFINDMIKQNVIKTGQTISDVFVNLIFITISAIVIFIAVKILFSLIAIILKSIIQNVSILNSTDKLLGMILGILTTGGFVFILIIVLTPIIFSFPGSNIANIFSESSILNYIYNSGIYSISVKSLLDIIN